MIILHTSDDEIVNNFEKFNDNDKMIDVRSVIFIQKFSKNLLFYCYIVLSIKHDWFQLVDIKALLNKQISIFSCYLNNWDETLRVGKQE